MIDEEYFFFPSPSLLFPCDSAIPHPVCTEDGRPGVLMLILSKEMRRQLVRETSRTAQHGAVSRQGNSLCLAGNLHHHYICCLLTTYPYYTTLEKAVGRSVGHPILWLASRDGCILYICSQESDSILSLFSHPFPAVIRSTTSNALEPLQPPRFNHSTNKPGQLQCRRWWVAM